MCDFIQTAVHLCLLDLQHKRESNKLMSNGSVKRCTTFAEYLALDDKTELTKLFYPDNFTALCSQLVDLQLCDVSALLSFLKLMLNLPVPGHVSVGLLLLKSRS